MQSGLRCPKRCAVRFYALQPPSLKKAFLYCQACGKRRERAAGGSEFRGWADCYIIERAETAECVGI